MPGNFNPNDYHLLPALKQKLGSQKFKSDCEVKQLWHNGWQYRTWISTGNRRALVLQYDVSDAVGTTWKSSKIPVQL